MHCRGGVSPPAAVRRRRFLPSPVGEGGFCRRQKTDEVFIARVKNRCAAKKDSSSTAVRRSPCLAAARSPRGSDSPPDCHSLPLGRFATRRRRYRHFCYPSLCLHPQYTTPSCQMHENYAKWVDIPSRKPYNKNIYAKRTIKRV